MDRRLPVYLVIDCSYSMRGEPIASVVSGVKKMICDLLSDPMALETVWLSIITFSTGAEQVVPLTELQYFQPPDLSAKGQTDLGAGLRILVERINSEVHLSSATEKGDWRPIIFLLSDGGPGDAWITPAKQIRAMHDSGRINAIAVAFGEHIHVDKLQRVTPQVIVTETAEPEVFAKFLKWVSTSVSRSCQVGSTERSFLLDAQLPQGFQIVQIGRTQ